MRQALCVDFMYFAFTLPAVKTHLPAIIDLVMRPAAVYSIASLPPLTQAWAHLTQVINTLWFLKRISNCDQPCCESTSVLAVEERIIFSTKQKHDSLKYDDDIMAAGVPRRFGWLPTMDLMICSHANTCIYDTSIDMPFVAVCWVQKCVHVQYIRVISELTCADVAHLHLNEFPLLNQWNFEFSIINA